MSEIGDDSSNSSSDKVGEPEEVVVFNNQICQNSIKGVIEQGDSDSDKKIAGGVATGSDVVNKDIVFVHVNIITWPVRVGK